MISSIRTRMLAITIGTVVFALALTSTVIYLIVRADNENTLRESLDAIAIGNSRAVEEWASAKALAVKATADAIEHGDAGGLAKSLLRTGGFSLTTVGWEDKVFVASTAGLPANYDPTDRPWYKESKATKTPQVTKPYKTVSGVPLVTFTAPILRDGNFSGVVAGGVSLENVRNVVMAIHPTPASIGFLVDKDGVIIAHPDAKFVLKPSTDLSPELVPAAFNGLTQSSDMVQLDLDGVPKLLRARAIPGTNWFVVVALDKREATAGMVRILGASALAVVVLTLIAALTCALMTFRSFRRLSEVRDAMDEIGSGNGDLTHRLPVVGSDEVAHIAMSFNVFVEKIESILREIRDGSESMSVATNEIEAGNQDLSRRTELAASNLQQTSASLEELTSGVNESAESTVKATRLAGSASDIAAKGREAVGAVVATMDDIARSSANIVEIIAVIDSIAFQTNILALNAAVEAARAGENGRGFAVVASEVRSLAQRSAVAAKEIKELIMASEKSVRSGAAKVGDAGRSMSEIVDGIERVTTIIEEINTSMRSQSSGINTINVAVADMEQSTQQNAALVEQAAASSSVLKEQAFRLNTLVSTFKLRETETLQLQ